MEGCIYLLIYLLILPHLVWQSSEIFSYKEVQFKKFCLPVRTSCPLLKRIVKPLISIECTNQYFILHGNIQLLGYQESCQYLWLTLRDNSNHQDTEKTNSIVEKFKWPRMIRPLLIIFIAQFNWFIVEIQLAIVFIVSLFYLLTLECRSFDFYTSKVDSTCKCSNFLPFFDVTKNTDLL